MKGKLTLRNILVLAAFVFGLIAFILAFSAGLKLTVEGAKLELRGLVIGKQKQIIGSLSEVVEGGAHARLSAAGVVLLLVAPLLAMVATLLLPKGKGKLILLACEVLVIVAVIFVAVMKDSYIHSVVAKQIKDSGVKVASDDKKAMIESGKKSLESYKFNGSAVGTIICGAFSAVCLTVAQMIKGK